MDWLTKKKTGINILYFSDVHMLHPRVRSRDIADRLQKLILNVIKHHVLDYIIIAGDFYDESGYLPDEDVFVVEEFIRVLIHLCAHNHIKLRILEGTPSHDRKQSRHFVKVNNFLSGKEKADLKYIETLDIVKEEDGSTWLYVPDEWHHDPDVVWKQVRDRLNQEGLTQVDFSVTHGMYKHHVPHGLDLKAHDPDRYLDITRYYVDNGHIHTKSVYKDRFITNGSPDRLAMGEEESKGIWMAHVSSHSRMEDKLFFFENKEATYMVTLDIKEHTFERSKEVIESHCHPTERRFIRLEISEELYSQGLMSYFQDLYPNIVWTKKVTRNDNMQVSFLEALNAKVHNRPINANTIEDLFLEEARLRNVDENEVIDALAFLKSQPFYVSNLPLKG